MKLHTFLLGATTALTLLLPGSGADAAERLFAIPVQSGNNIVELDPATGGQLNIFAAPEAVSGSAGQDGLAFDGQSLWFVTGAGSDKLWELNPDTGAVISATQLPAGNYDGVAALGGKIYIEEWVNQDILEFDPTTDTVIRTLDMNVLNPGSNIRGGLAGAGDLLVAMSFFSTVLLIDPATGAVTDSFPAGPGTNTGVAVLGNEIYVGEVGSTRVDVFSRDGTLVRFFNAPFGVSALGADWVDSDGDGVPDSEDACPDSDLRDWVDTGSGDTSVPNLVDDDGCSIQDLVNAIAAGARNHGQYVSGIAQLANELRRAGVITNKQAAELKNGAARSSKK